MCQKVMFPGAVTPRVLTTAAVPKWMNLLRKSHRFFLKHLFSQNENTAMQAGSALNSLWEIKRRLAGFRKVCSLLISCTVKAEACLWRAAYRGSVCSLNMVSSAGQEARFLKVGVCNINISSWDCCPRLWSSSQ